MDPTRRFRPIPAVPGVGTDDISSEGIPDHIAAFAFLRVILLRFVCKNLVTGENVHYVGQAGILRNPKNPNERVLATAEHNLGTAKNKLGEIEACISPHECSVPGGWTAEIVLPHTGWEKHSKEHAVELRNGETWSNGFDISLGPVLDENTAESIWPDDDRVRQRFLHVLCTQKKAQSWDVIGDHFTYEIGLRIGIVAYNPNLIATEDKAFVSTCCSNVVDAVSIEDERSFSVVSQGVKNAKINRVFGEEVMIYTGCITHVGAEYIEYNVNTFKGCSGAMVIVLDERANADLGKVLAIHAGYQTELNTNLGFKLAGAFDRPFSSEEEW
jgi:hypothetical protein